MSDESWGVRTRRANGWQQLSDQPPVMRYLVADGTCSRALGSQAVIAALQAAVTADGQAAQVVPVGCSGACWANVAVTVQRPGEPDVVYGQITPDQASALVARTSGNAPAGQASPLRPLDPDVGQTRLVGGNLGRLDPLSLAEARAQGAYAAWADILASKLAPEAVIARVKEAGLLGRGGAYFPTGVKWENCRQVSKQARYLVVNAEEGEPGIYKDRHLLEGDPHRFLEGMLIAAYALGADRAYLYLNGEAALSLQRLRVAIEQAGAAGLLGENILGSGFRLAVELRRGAGGYVLGEETVMLTSIEGDRALPRLRPPFPVEAGLWGQPTAINNVETLTNVPALFSDAGLARFSELGTPRARGTKLLCLQGHVARPGLVEVPFGTPLRQVIQEVGGGIPGGNALKAVLTAGPSGGVLPESLLDTVVEPAALVEAGSVLGAGGVIVMDETVCLVDVVRQLTAYNAHESCGKCTPCREGTHRATLVLDRLAALGGSVADVEQLAYLSDVIAPASLCGLGQMAPNPIVTGLRHFRADFEAHARQRRCPTGACDGTWGSRES